jgi:hypothetical protein
LQGSIFPTFVNNVREKMVDEGFIGRRDFERDVAVLECHLSGSRPTIRVNYRPDVSNGSEAAFSSCRAARPQFFSKRTLHPPCRNQADRAKTLVN